MDGHWRWRLTQKPFTRVGSVFFAMTDYPHVLAALLNGGYFEDSRILLDNETQIKLQNLIGKLEAGLANSEISFFNNNMDMGFGSSAKQGLGFLLHSKGTLHDRQSGSASWVSLLNPYFWIDPDPTCL